ncbi:MAG: tetratricopeptide repeat protein [Candidatus Kariarchaeaceae archaeon]|jgi:tetratricopeptide (TPR) repeat protein
MWGFHIRINEIKLLILKSQFDEALIKIEQSDENHLDLTILKSLVLRKKEMYNAACNVGKEALHEARDSNSIIHEFGALVQLAYSHMMMHQMDQANSSISEFDALWKGLSDNEKEDFRELEGYMYHIKGTMNSFHYETNQAIDNYDRSLQIQQTVENSIEILSTLNNLSFVYTGIGEYDKGQDYAEQQLTLSEELGQQSGLIFAYENLGILEELKGEYDAAVDYYTKGLTIANEMNLRFSIANCTSHIGSIHYLNGEYDLAFKNFTKALIVLEDLNMSIFVAQIIFSLIEVCIKLGLSKQTDNYLIKLNKLYESNKIKGIAVFKKLSQAVILKNNPRARDKITAQNLFEEVLNESVNVETSSLAILNLSELLLDELKTYGSEEVLEEIEDKTRQLYELAQEHQLYPLIVEVLVLRAKLSFMKLELDETTKILNQANLIAEERGLKNLVRIVENETKKIENEISLAADITRRSSTIQERIDKAQIIEYIEKMQHLIKTTN